jgi:hypothetical protein
MGNPHGKYLNDLGATDEIPFSSDPNEFSWNNQNFEIQGKHLRDIWVKVIGLDHGKQIPSMLSLGDFRAELTHLSTDPILQVWYDLDNQPSSLSWSPPVRPRTGSKAAALPLFSEFTNATEDLKVGQESLSLPDGQVRITIKLKNKRYSLKRSDSDYDSKESLL